MNAFIARLVETLGKAGINTLLVKGQGIAQCYEKPLWRTNGDVDLYLSTDNYEKAKAYLIPKAQTVETEDKKRLHLGMTIEGWLVELHGTMHTSLSRRRNRMSDEVYDSIFYHGNVRGWNNNGVQVSLPAPDEDVIIIFNHFISHFYLEGVGLRQICYWCRLLYTYRESVDYGLLESRIRRMGLMTEWKAFAVIAVEYLGMPEEAMPMYDGRFKAKGEKVLGYVMKSGNFGHNKDNSYRGRYSVGMVNIITFFRRIKDFMKLSLIFPQNSPRFFLSYMLERVKAKV